MPVAKMMSGFAKVVVRSQPTNFVRFHQTPCEGPMSQNLKSIFIDGEAGTTGLGIRERLADVPEVVVKSIDPDKRKDPGARKAMMAGVDLVVLCLPDDAAKESVALADELGTKAPKIVDASTAHRVANPGCYPTGGIALLRPLVDAGLLPKDHPVTVNAVSGYSGGGKSMIEAYEAGTAPDFELYGLGLKHKHLPELQVYSRLERRPIFVPSVGNFRQGMLVSVPLHLDTLPGKPKPADLEAALTERYAGSTYVSVLPADASGKLEPQALNDTNKLELRVFGNADLGQAVLIARLDNLGKGASGAAVQNIRLMLGLPEG
jgi:N-acetyl-gamma-glutamyl-phosphate reductase